MDANQLAEGIARAVEVAKPAQEYCLLSINHWSTCMTKAEWSGWMQATGAVVAIWWSGKLASRQIAAARRQASEQIDAARAQAASQIDAAREQAKVSHLEARKLVADQRRLDDLLKTEVLSALFADALAYCRRIYEALEAPGSLVSETPEYERLKEVGHVLRQLPAFEVPGQPLAVLTIRIAKDIEALCATGLKLPPPHEGVLYSDRALVLKASLRDASMLLEEAVRLCDEQIEMLSVLSTGARVS